MCKICCKTAKFATKLKGALNFASQTKRCVGEMAPKPGNPLILGAKLSILRKMANFAANFAMQILHMQILLQILHCLELSGC